MAKTAMALVVVVLAVWSIARAQEAATQPSEPAVVAASDEAALDAAKGKKVIVEGSIGPNSGSSCSFSVSGQACPDTGAAAWS